MSEEISKERKFLHDLASPIAGLKLTIRRIHQSMSVGKPEMSNAEIIERLDRCIKFVDKMETLHAEFKLNTSSSKIAS